jgi:hypothetical protein
MASRCFKILNRNTSIQKADSRKNKSKWKTFASFVVTFTRIMLPTPGIDQQK